MYKTDFETLSQEMKEELVTTAFNGTISIDDIISLEQKKSSKYKIKEICSYIFSDFLPNFWIVAEKSTNSSKDFFYIIFEKKLTKQQEKIFFQMMGYCKYNDSLNAISFSDKFGIY